MKLHRFGTLAVLAALAIAASAAPAGATPVTVNLRIEGSNATVYEGPVTTDAKMITTAHSGGAHECDGTNGGTPNTPGATPTTALDDASIAHGFSWDGSFNTSFDDFFVERIGSDGQVGTVDPNGNFWDLLVNRAPAQAGGCQIRVSDGDTVLLEWQDGSHPNLQLSAPASAQTGQAVPVKVQQYSDASGTLSPAAGASVGGQLTDASGDATLTFSTAGTQHLKATRADAVRSNDVDICVYAPGSGACGTSGPPSGSVQGALQDKLPPSIALRGIRNHERFRHGHGPRTLRGSATDAGGLFGVYFRLERRSGRGCQWYSSKRSLFTRASRGCRHARFQRLGTKSSWSYLLPERLPKGLYRLEEKAIDRSFNAARKSLTFRVL